MVVSGSVRFDFQPVSDVKTTWWYSDKLPAVGMPDKQLDKDRIIIHQANLVDTSILEGPIQRNTRDESKELKEGRVPQDWSENKLCQKDTNAQWVTHHETKYFGYKNHIKPDSETKLITGYHTKTANIHDSEIMVVLLDKEEDSDQDLYADSAYRSEAIEMACIKKGMNSCIHEKEYRGRPLTKRQQQRNRKKSKTRAGVEHTFAFMTNNMNEKYLCYRSFKKNVTRCFYESKV